MSSENQTINEESSVETDSQNPENAALDSVAELAAQVAEYKDKYLRALADLENYKKRALKERSDLIKYQGDRIITDLLEVADNLERAISSSTTDINSLKEGLPLIYKNLVDTFSKWDIKAESGLGKPFDPAKFVAISKVSVDDAVPGTIVTELRKTYFYKDKLLRAGEVVVAAEQVKPIEAKAEENTEESIG